MRQVIAVLALAAAAAVQSANISAIQPVGQSGFSRVSGVVIDKDGGVIPGVTMTLTSGNAASFTAVTNASGRFEIANVPAGACDLSASIPGFMTARSRLQLVANQTATTNVRLSVGSVTDSLVVRAPATPRPEIPPAVAPPIGPVRVGGDIRPPQMLTRVEPDYPAAAVAGNIEGTVVIEGTIARDGTVRDAIVVQGIPELDASALKAVRQWTYSPTMLNGVPVEVKMTVSVAFRAR